MIIANVQILGLHYIIILDREISKQDIDSLRGVLSYVSLVEQLREKGYRVITELEIKHYAFMTMRKDHHKLYKNLSEIITVNLDGVQENKEGESNKKESNNAPSLSGKDKKKNYPWWR